MAAVQAETSGSRVLNTVCCLSPFERVAGEQRLEYHRGLSRSLAQEATALQTKES